MKKFFALAISLTLAVAIGVGGTMAWLTHKTDEIQNTFTVGKVKIGLKETDNLSLKMIPGQPITKDPKVTVDSDSEDCWLFVKVTEDGNLTTFIDYTVNQLTGEWTKLTTTTDNVYYRAVKTSDSTREFNIIGYNKGDNFQPNQVLVKDSVTQTLTVTPTLTFTAYAIQQAGFSTADVAWPVVSAAS